jgi:hypothetical protein
MAELNFSATSNLQLNESLYQLRELLSNQLHDIRLFKDIADVIIKEQHLLKSAASLPTYEEQIRHVTMQQQERFMAIDRLLNEHVAVKKGKGSDEQTIVLGKEVRKIEAGIRTIKLFLVDVLNMLNPELNVINRIDDRIQYFNKRSMELENDIALLSAKLS